jgi:hypothetical protein
MKKITFVLLILVLNFLTFIACATGNDTNVLSDENVILNESIPTIDTTIFPETIIPITTTNHSELITPPITTISESEEQGDIIMVNDEIQEIYIHSDWRGYRNSDELFERATLVIRAEVIDDGRYEMRNINRSLPDPIPDDMLELLDKGILSFAMFEPHYVIMTIHQVKVLEIFKGDIKVGDIVDVRQRGGEMDGVRVISDDIIPFTKGDNLVLFLSVSNRDGSAGLLTPWYSVYRYPSQTGIMAFSVEGNDNRELENVDERNNLTLTIGDLRNRNQQVTE